MRGQKDTSIGLKRLSWMLLLSSLLVSGCGVKKRVPGVPYPGGKVSKREAIEAYSTYNPDPAIRLNSSVVLIHGDKEMGSNARLTVVRDQFFHFSLRVMSFLEAAQGVITHDEVVILNRIQREAYVASMDEIAEAASPYADRWDLTAMQSILLQEPFSLSKRGVEALKEMKFKATNKGYTFWQERSDRSVVLSFSPLHEIQQAEYRAGKHGELTVIAQYDGSNRKVSFSLPLGKEGKQTQILIDAKAVKQSEQMSCPDLTPPRGYRQYGLEQMMKRFEKR